MGLPTFTKAGRLSRKRPLPSEGEWQDQGGSWGRAPSRGLGGGSPAGWGRRIGEGSRGFSSSREASPQHKSTRGFHEQQPGPSNHTERRSRGPRAQTHGRPREHAHPGRDRPSFCTPPPKPTGLSSVLPPCTWGQKRPGPDTRCTQDPPLPAGRTRQWSAPPCRQEGAALDAHRPARFTDENAGELGTRPRLCHCPLPLQPGDAAG